MVYCAENESFAGGVERLKRRYDDMLDAGIDLENPWPDLMHSGDALQALKDMREDTLLDGEMGEGGRRLNPISGVHLDPFLAVTFTVEPLN